MQNWWRKHDMDRDGKGCFFIVLVLAGVLVFVGAGLGMIFTIALFKLI
ncbi:membrane protein [Streptomyces phage Dryad]|nr:membrane protein [Streptomyces phage Dryad]